MTSMRAFGPTRRSTRVRYPTASPTRSPRLAASRTAAARAARRRGSSTYSGTHGLVQIRLQFVIPASERAMSVGL